MAKRNRRSKKPVNKAQQSKLASLNARLKDSISTRAGALKRDMKEVGSHISKNAKLIASQQIANHKTNSYNRKKMLVVRDRAERGVSKPGAVEKMQSRINRNNNGIKTQQRMDRAKSMTGLSKNNVLIRKYKLAKRLGSAGKNMIKSGAKKIKAGLKYHLTIADISKPESGGKMRAKGNLNHVRKDYTNKETNKQSEAQRKFQEDLARRKA